MDKINGNEESRRSCSSHNVIKLIITLDSRPSTSGSNTGRDLRHGGGRERSGSVQAASVGGDHVGHLTVASNQVEELTNSQAWRSLFSDPLLSASRLKALALSKEGLGDEGLDGGVVLRSVYWRVSLLP
jgi:hypothetical protein